MQAGRKTYQDSSEVDWAPLTLSGAQTLCLPSFGPLSDKRKATAVTALRAAIIADAKDGLISSIGIMKQLPVAFRLSKTGPNDGRQRVCAPDKVSGAQSTSLLSWYVFLPACIKANSER